MDRSSYDLFSSREDLGAGEKMGNVTVKTETLFGNIRKALSEMGAMIGEKEGGLCEGAFEDERRILGMALTSVEVLEDYVESRA